MRTDRAGRTARPGRPRAADGLLSKESIMYLQARRDAPSEREREKVRPAKGLARRRAAFSRTRPARGGRSADGLPLEAGRRAGTRLDGPTGRRARRPRDPDQTRGVRSRISRLEAPEPDRDNGARTGRSRATRRFETRGRPIEIRASRRLDPIMGARATRIESRASPIEIEELSSDF